MPQHPQQNQFVKLEPLENVANIGELGQIDELGHAEPFEQFGFDQEYDISGDFNTAYNQFYNNEALFTPLLSERESYAITDFLDKVSVDPNFIPDSKIEEQFKYFDSVAIDSSAAQRQLHIPEATVDTMVEQIQPMMESKAPDNFVARQASVEYHSEPETYLLPATDLPPAPLPQPPSRQSQKVLKQQPAKKEYLSEDQKRRNHVSSEKRRRDYIKSKFKEICASIPALQGKSMKSKSVILHAIYEYMLELTASNQSIRMHLERAHIDTSSVVSASNHAVTNQDSIH